VITRLHTSYVTSSTCQPNIMHTLSNDSLQKIHLLSLNMVNNRFFFNYDIFVDSILPKSQNYVLFLQFWWIKPWQFCIMTLFTAASYVVYANSLNLWRLKEYNKNEIEHKFQHLVFKSWSVHGASLEKMMQYSMVKSHTFNLAQLGKLCKWIRITILENDVCAWVNKIFF